jgi:hypothetical protein
MNADELMQEKMAHWGFDVSSDGKWFRELWGGFTAEIFGNDNDLFADPDDEVWQCQLLDEDDNIFLATDEPLALDNVLLEFKKYRAELLRRHPRSGH